MLSLNTLIYYKSILLRGHIVPTSSIATIRSNFLKLPSLATEEAMVDEKVEMSNDTETFTSISSNDPKYVQELTQYVQNLLESIQSKFQNMSDQILSRIDEMGNRIDDLEKNIGDLMTQAGVEGSEK
ncbi:hypothetical protein RN001_007052 [Aquatica leii]|uniref:Heat shock factor-binding protein 1 n=1 Tax=Aquatica leii TaxID=1421715 RepID=A0AAN7PB56_9COLE|nr:hypothetical protein RN001_007052 [Aquatica leii]